MKKTILAIALAAVSTTAFADTSVSGHVNYAMGSIEDFNGNEDITVDDATTSQSRFRIKSSIESNGFTYGIAQEYGLNNGAVGIRQNELYVKGGFGKLTLGQGSEAGDGAVENDFSGTYVTQGDLGVWHLSDLRVLEDTDNDEDTPDVVTGGADFTFSTPDGGRTERLRYDTPKLGIFTAAVSYDTEDTVAAEVNLGGSMWKASVYTASKGDAAGDTDEVGGSVAIKLGGFTAALQAADVDNGVEYTNVILGYNAGKVSVSVDLKTNESDAGLDKETTGLNFVYRPTKGVELYAGYRTVDDNAAGVLLEDSGDGFLMGGRVKF